MSKWKINTLNICCLPKRLTTNWCNLKQLFALPCSGQQTTGASVKPTPKRFSMNQQKPIPCTVVEMYPLSPTVRGLKLQVHSQKFSFQAGQWVDFIVPGIESLAGYSICSSPKYFQDCGLIELAVKKSPYPPTEWVHQQCQVGSKITVSLGGKFIYNANPATHAKHLLLIAGGVGINPLISILRHLADSNSGMIHKNPHPTSQILMLYSTQTLEELLFKDDICEIMAQMKNLSVEYFITEHKGNSLTQYKGASITTNRRISKDILSSRLQPHFAATPDWECYLCGPIAMIDEINAVLKELGLKAEQIKFEKWW